MALFDVPIKGPFRSDAHCTVRLFQTVRRPIDSILMKIQTVRGSIDSILMKIRRTILMKIRGTIMVKIRGTILMKIRGTRVPRRRRSRGLMRLSIRLRLDEIRPRESLKGRNMRAMGRRRHSVADNCRRFCHQHHVDVRFERGRRVMIQLIIDRVFVQRIVRMIAEKF